MRLEPLFRPMSIAVVGASEKPTIGRRLTASLDRFGPPGRYFRSAPFMQPGWIAHAGSVSPGGLRGQLERRNAKSRRCRHSKDLRAKLVSRAHRSVGGPNATVGKTHQMCSLVRDRLTILADRSAERNRL